MSKGTKLNEESAEFTEESPDGVRMDEESTDSDHAVLHALFRELYSAAFHGNLEKMKLIMTNNPKLLKVHEEMGQTLFDFSFQSLVEALKEHKEFGDEVIRNKGGDRVKYLQLNNRIDKQGDVIEWLFLEGARGNIPGVELINDYIKASELLNSHQLSLLPQKVKSVISSFFLMNEFKSIDNHNEFRYELLQHAHIKKASEFMAQTIIKVFNKHAIPAQSEYEINTDQLSELIQKELSENSDKFNGFVLKELQAELMSRIYKLMIQPEVMPTDQSIKDAIYQVIDTIPASLRAKYALVEAEKALYDAALTGNLEKMKLIMDNAPDLLKTDESLSNNLFDIALQSLRETIKIKQAFMIEATKNGEGNIVEYVSINRRVDEHVNVIKFLSKHLCTEQNIKNVIDNKIIAVIPASLVQEYGLVERNSQEGREHNDIGDAAQLEGADGGMQDANQVEALGQVTLNITENDEVEAIGQALNITNVEEFI